MPKNLLPPRDPEALRLENERRKRELEQEFGAVFGSFSSDLPAEIENQFLRNVLEFERQHQAAGSTTVYDFIGRPTIRPPDELKTESEFAAEVERLFALFEDNHIRLDVLGNYPAETLYRFIVDEFFLLEKDNIRIPGMYSGYIYEEFHPNHDLEIRERIENLLNWLIDEDRHGSFYGFDDTVVDETGTIWTREQFNKRLQGLRARFNEMKLIRLDIEKVDFRVEDDRGEATVVALIEVEGWGPGSKFWFAKDFAEIGLTCSYNYWSIHRFCMRGLWL